jgi:ATP-dependent Clp protease protease subunit
MMPPDIPVPAEIYVSFSAEISAATAQALIQTMTSLSTRQIPKVNLLLSTPGGDVMAGINIYNILKARPYELHIFNMGNIDSIGNVIFQTARERFACVHSTFLFHGVASGPSAVPMGELFLEERLKSVKADQAQITEILAAKTSMDEPTINDLFLHSKNKNAPQALADGIIDEIRDPHISSGAEIIAFAFNH